MHFVRSTETSPPSVCSSNWSTRRNGAPGSSSKPHVGSEAGAWPLGHAIAAHEARNQLAVWQNFACRKRHPRDGRDRKSTRLNSSHVRISYAVFCLKKK